MSETQKRKRDDGTAELRVSSYTEEPTVTVSTFFNGFDAPQDTEIDLYKKKNAESLVFHGENSTLDFDGKPSSDDMSEYAIAVYDPLNRSVDLYKTPVFLGSVTSKSNRKLKGPAIKQKGVRLNEQRNALGQAFGTKRAKKAISDLERNRIDADKLADVQADIIDTVKAGTNSLPSRAQLTASVDNDRPTPLADVTATNVADVYPIYNIIPKKELAAIRVSSILNETDSKERLSLLPYQDSAYINEKLDRLDSDSDPLRVQLIYYASLLIGFYQNRRIGNKSAVITELNNPPEILVDGLLDRFAISRPGQFGRSKDRGYKVDPHSEDKLLCYLLTVILHIGGFIVEVTPLAKELSIKPSRLLELFKVLGCTVKSATVAEAEAFGLSKNAASTYKIASLKVPFKLPQMTKRGRRT